MTRPLHLTLTALDPDGPNLIRATLTYDPTDPYAVTLHLPNSNDWTFARELITRGLTRHTGLGDVQIWPHPTHHPPHLYLALTSPDGHMTFLTPARPVAAWLARTYRQVPPGQETSHLPDPDEELATLTEQEHHDG